MREVYLSKNKEDLDDLSPVLEEVGNTEIPDMDSETFFSEDVSQIAAKLTVSESLFKLLTANVNFHDFMREILITVTKVIKCEAASILEVNHVENNIFFRAAVGHSSDRVVKFVIPMGKGIVGHVIESRQPLIVANVAENKQHLTAITQAVGFETRNMVAFPIFVRGKVFGVIELINRIGEDEFTEEDIDMINSINQLISKAIEIRMMMAWVREKAKRAS